MVIVRIWEGLGNQMFQYAYAKALQHAGNDVRLDFHKSYDVTFEKYRNHVQRKNSIQNFKLSLKGIDVYRYGKYAYLERNTNFKKIVYELASHDLWKYKFYEEKEQKYSKKSAGISGNYYVKGWFQSEKYFKDIRCELLRDFVPRKKIEIRSDMQAILQQEETVSIHVRRGDYVRIRMQLGAGYYEKAIERIREFYQTPVFLFFSDDIGWVRKHICVDAPCIYVNENGELHDYEELYLMSLCKSNIIANSTFSWWGAWLNQNKDKHVIAPRKWYCGQEGIVPKEWIVI